METEYGTITKSTSKNVTITEDNCLESSNIESSSDSSMIEPTIVQLDESQQMLLEFYD